MPNKEDPYAYPPRGMSREAACRYIGVGLRLFDEMANDGRMPVPKEVNSRVIWDRVALDVHFSSLPDQERDTRTRFQRFLDGDDVLSPSPPPCELSSKDRAQKATERTKSREAADAVRRAQVSAQRKRDGE